MGEDSTPPRFLFRPRWPSLTPPGGPLLRIMPASGMICSVTISDDCVYAIVEENYDKRPVLWELVAGTSRRLPVMCAACSLSPDGTLAAVVDRAGAISLWSVPDCRRVANLERGCSASRHPQLQFSFDGRSLISSAQSVVSIWDLSKGSVRYRFEACGPIWLRLSRDSRTLVGTAIDPVEKGCASAWVWDLETGRLRGAIGNNSTFSKVVLSGSGQLALSTQDFDNRVLVWDLDRLVQQDQIESHPSRVRDIGLSADGRTAVSVSREMLRFWNPASGTVLQTCTEPDETKQFSSVALSNDGSLAIVALDDGLLKAWRVPSQRESAVLDGHRSGLSPRVALALKKDIAASWSIGPSEPAIKTWDLRALGGRTVLREHQGHNPSVQIDRNGALAASTAVSNEGWSLRVWNLGTGVLAAHLDGGRGALCVSGDCRSALSWGTRGLLAWNTITGAATVLEGDKGGPIAFALSYDGRRALTSTDGGKLLCWEVPERRFRVLASRDVNRVAISPDGTIGACLSKQGWLCAWNLDTLEVVGRIEVPFDGSLTLGGGGELAMVEAFSETAVCNLGSGALDRLQEPHLASTALSANAGLAAIGFGVRLRLWGCRERKVLCEIPVLSPHPEYPTNAVYRLQVSDDGKYVASLSEDRALRVFDTSGRELAIFTSESRFFAVDIAWAKRRIVAIDFLGRIHYLSLENCPPVGRPRS